MCVTSMARHPDAKAKETISFKARNEGEKKLIGDFKSLCIQDSIDQIDLFAEALDQVFKLHHWPPGNPQLTLTNYHVEPFQVLKCGYNGCKGDAVGSGLYLPQHKRFELCSEHFALAKNVSKVWGSLATKETKPTGKEVPNQ